LTFGELNKFVQLFDKLNKQIEEIKMCYEKVRKMDVDDGTIINGWRVVYKKVGEPVYLSIYTRTRLKAKGWNRARNVKVNRRKGLELNTICRSIPVYSGHIYVPDFKGFGVFKTYEEALGFVIGCKSIVKGFQLNIVKAVVKDNLRFATESYIDDTVKVIIGDSMKISY